MKDNLYKNSRWIMLAIIIIAIHLAIALYIRGCGNSKSEPAEKSTTETVSKPSWWQKLFSEKKGDEKNSSPAPEKKADDTEIIQNQPEPAVVYRRKPADLPLFGTGFDFSHARHGELPDYYAPGSSGAKSGIVVDLTNRKVLWEKNCRQKTATASMAKLMTILLFMEHLDKNPDITLDSKVLVPKGVMNVPRTGVVYLVPGEEFIYSDIVKAAAIKSANDAAEMLAISVAGDSRSFASLMNQKARSIGMESTRFINAHGLSEKDKTGKQDFSTSTALDMVILGEKLLEYPVVMKYFSTQQESLRKVKPLVYTNTNKLINPRYPGVDGMKTGFTKAAGFCLVFSAKRDGKRIMGCVTGFKSRVDRDRFCRKLIDWSFNPEKKIAVDKSQKNVKNNARKSVKNKRTKTKRK